MQAVWHVKYDNTYFVRRKTCMQTAHTHHLPLVVERIHSVHSPGRPLPFDIRFMMGIGSAFGRKSCLCPFFFFFSFHVSILSHTQRIRSSCFWNKWHESNFRNMCIPSPCCRHFDAKCSRFVSFSFSFLSLSSRASKHSQRRRGFSHFRHFVSNVCKGEHNTFENSYN